MPALLEWLGQHQKLTEHVGSISTVEMGARQYVPNLGRFLEAAKSIVEGDQITQVCARKA